MRGFAWKFLPYLRPYRGRLALAILQVLLAGYFFARVFRYTVRTGLLARYSAESVG